MWVFMQLHMYIDFYLIKNMVQSQLGGINGVSSALLGDVKAYSVLTGPLPSGPKLYSIMARQWYAV